LCGNERGQPLAVHDDLAARTADIEEVGMTESGVVTRASGRGFAETLSWLHAALLARGMTIFATIDHAAGAVEAGMTLRPTTVTIFGNPRAGTPLMQAQQIIGLDLPLKMLIWEDAEARVWLSYDDPAALARRHGVDPTMPPIAAMAAGLAALAQAIGKV
jgi:uncharacterized protein (DUF302 family)